jgi:hypothetical protein
MNSKLKGANFDNSKKTYNIKKVQYENTKALEKKF